LAYSAVHPSGFRLRLSWNEAIAFADIVYRLTRGFPPEERFGLTNQMRRAAVSISSNLAEGCSRSSKADYARFVEIATGSVFEVVSQATISLNYQLSTINYLEPHA
jgi:four helix bundle protein